MKGAVGAHAQRRKKPDLGPWERFDKISKAAACQARSWTSEAIVLLIAKTRHPRRVRSFGEVHTLPGLIRFG